MALKAPVKESFERELIPEDSHQAVCYAVIDLGTHKSEWNGEERDRHEVVLSFEIPSLRIEYEKDGENFEGPKVISKRYTFSMSEKANLRKDMETWRGKPFTNLEAADFDFESLIGVNAILQVMHKEKKDGNKYAFIASITKILKGMEKLKPENPPMFFTFIAPYVDENGCHWPESMPEWMQKYIMESLEYGWILDKPDSKLDDDGVPF